MKVMACQLDIQWEDKAANHARTRELLRRHAPEPGALVVLPEMYSTGYSMNVPGIREGSKRPSEAFLAEVASEYGVYVQGGVVTQGEGGLGRNEAVTFDPDGQEMLRYAKLHPFSYSGEHRHYEAGTEVVLLQCGVFTVSPFICYDLRFPEVFRSAVRRGAELLTVIANWPESREAHWTALLRARAIENQAYVVGVNRCGTDPHLGYSGRSLVLGPRGDVLAEAGTEEGVIEAELSRDELLAYRKEFPVLSDMHPEFVL